jgi:hypothetical protein
MGGAAGDVSGGAEVAAGLFFSHAESMPASRITAIKFLVLMGVSCCREIIEHYIKQGPSWRANVTVNRVFYLLGAQASCRAGREFPIGL